VSLVNKVQRFGGAARRRSDDRARIVPARILPARVALCAVFAAHGFIFASWAVRVPAVKAQTGASPAVLGLALLGLSAGAVATMLLAGALCRRFGSQPLAILSCALLSVTLVLPALARSAPALGLALLAFGAAYGCLNVAMNSIAVDLVAAVGRPIMPSFHAAWSFGGLAGASLGGLLAPHLSPERHLLLIALTGLLVTASAAPVLLASAHWLPGAAARQATSPPEGMAPMSPADRQPSGNGAAPMSPADRQPSGNGEVPMSPADRQPSRNGVVPASRQARPERQGSAWHRTLGTGRVVGVFGLIALCTAYDEGAIGDWGALHLRQDLGAGAGLAAAGYAAFALAEATARLSGTSLLSRMGRTRVLVLGGLAACAGMLLASLAPDIWLALVGFAVTGLGLANLFPAAIARAGLLAGANGVALTSLLGYSGFLLGPPAIGFLASVAGLRVGLTTLSFLALAAATIAYLSRDSGGP
jgi:MFS family permease